MFVAIASGLLVDPVRYSLYSDDNISIRPLTTLGFCFSLTLLIFSCLFGFYRSPFDAPPLHFSVPVVYRIIRILRMPVVIAPGATALFSRLQDLTTLTLD